MANYVNTWGLFIFTLAPPHPLLHAELSSMCRVRHGATACGHESSFNFLLDDHDFVGSVVLEIVVEALLRSRN